MSKHRKSWSVEEKERIVLFSQENGNAVASREFEVSVITISNWKKKFIERGSGGLEAGSMSEMERELRALRRENRELKNLVADKELALQIKDSRPLQCKQYL
jgi:transposase-like protein